MQKALGCQLANKHGNLANLGSAFRRLEKLPNLKAVVITKPGAPEVLQVQDRPMPEPSDWRSFDQGICRWRQSSRCRAAQRALSATSRRFADIPGLEISGIVERLGKDCSILKVGDKICALVSGGGYAEYCCVPEGQCLPIPRWFIVCGGRFVTRNFFYGLEQRL